MTLSVRGVVKLFRLVKREEELRRQILAFSISHDHRMVRIYGHYPVTDGEKTTYYRHSIHEFSFTALGGREKWTSYKFVMGIYNDWAPSHFRRLCSAIDELPEQSELSFSESTGLSQGIEGVNVQGSKFTSVLGEESQPAALSDSQNARSGAPVTRGNEKKSRRVPFILMSKAKGSPLSTRSWYPQPYQIPKAAPRQWLKQREKKKVMKQLGEMISRLSCLRFDKMGSFEDTGCFSVQACLSPGLLLHDRHALQGFFRWLFCSEKDYYYKSLLSAFFQHILFLTLEHHTFFAPVPVPSEYNSYDSYLPATDKWNDYVTLGSKIDSSKNRLDYFITGRILEGMIPSLTTESDAIMGSFEVGYPLHHLDLSASNIFVDDDYNITCIIDWAFSSSVPIAMLLATPGLPHPRDEIEPALDSAFRASVAKYFMREKKVTLHQTVWEMTRKVRLLQDYSLFAQLYTLVYEQQR
ncbi:hypothetical protein ACJ73_00375 [Blastomyces percursus]|uniref:DUF7924 domain-containing protein n=1 Tax=Blastomyces percursus TaxID=1658174 RepID=A0A1J9QJF8_9EURO|nr:hypothetical protein ACJ73_00375 [Blastomyces percursus]